MISTDLNHMVCEELFGWKWISFIGHPKRKGGPTPPECRVRRFFPPLDAPEMEEWRKWFARPGVEPRDATGDEPLSYAYCSSMPPHQVPNFTTDRNACFEMECELRRRGLWDIYRSVLALQIGACARDQGCSTHWIDEEAFYFADCENRVSAALAVVIGAERRESSDESQKNTPALDSGPSTLDTPGGGAMSGFTTLPTRSHELDFVTPKKSFDDLILADAVKQSLIRLKRERDLRHVLARHNIKPRKENAGLETLGALHDFWAAGKILSDLKGIAGEKAAAVADAYADYAKEHPELYGLEEAVLDQLRASQRFNDGCVSGMLLGELSRDWQSDVAELRRLGHEIDIDVYGERFFLVRLK